MKLESFVMALAIVLETGCEGPAAHLDASTDTARGSDGAVLDAIVDRGGDVGGERTDDASLPAHDAGMTALGSATLRPELTCEPDGSGLAGSTCSVLTISCPGVADMEVELRVSAEGAEAPLGVVLLGSGGNGTRWSNGYRGVARALSSEGHRVLERRWRSERAAGWLEGGMSAGACRYATLVRWIAENETPPGAPLCVSGNSGGAGEIGTALTRQGLDEIVDLAVMTSGPMARVDYACGANDTWAPLCEPLVSAHTWSCDRADATAPSCAPLGPERALFDDAYLPVVAACSEPTDDHLALLAASSAVPPGASPDLSTNVHILLGGSDCSLAPSQGLFFASLVTAHGAPIPVQVVEGAPHELPSSIEGEAALLAAIREGCSR